MTARVAVFRAIGRCCSDKCGQPGPELLSTAVRRVPDPRLADRRLGDPAHWNQVTPGGELLEKLTRRLDLVGARATVGLRLAGPVRMRRHDVPEQHVPLEAKLVEHTVDDRRRRFSRAASRQLALRGEGNAAQARASVPGRLADEQ